MRKNPENKPLKVVWDYSEGIDGEHWMYRANLLAQIAVAQSNLVKAGKASALPHFLACIKEIENIAGFHFEILEEEEDQ